MGNSGMLNDLKLLVENEGMFTLMRREDDGLDRLICQSSATGGNSFWILYSDKHEKWYLATWSPVYYLLPGTDVDAIFSVVLEILHSQDRVMWQLPDELTQKHGIFELQARPDL